jgi:hypothetical protein
MIPEMIARGLLYSDIHLSSRSVIGQERWYPPVCTVLKKLEGIILPKGASQRFLDSFDRETKKSMDVFLSDASKQGPFDFTIGFGDYVAGDNESGMIGESILDYLHFKERFNAVFGGISSSRVWGDHCVGYRFDVSGKVGLKIGTEQGGVSEKSVDIARRHIGEPFGVHEINNSSMRFVRISTNLIRNVNSSSPKELQKLKAEQKEFLRIILGRAEHWRSIFLCMHDPTALPLDKDMPGLLYMFKNKIAAILHGHMHAEYSRQLVKLTYPFYARLCRDFQVHLVPSSMGMLGFGRGFRVLDIFSDGTYTIEKHDL